MPSWHGHLNVDRHICCMRTQVLCEVLPAVPDTDWYADMAADDVCASCAADAGVQAPMMRAKTLHLQQGM